MPRGAFCCLVSDDTLRRVAVSGPLPWRVSMISEKRRPTQAWRAWFSCRRRLLNSPHPVMKLVLVGDSELVQLPIRREVLGVMLRSLIYCGTPVRLSPLPPTGGARFDRQDALQRDTPSRGTNAKREIYGARTVPSGGRPALCHILPWLGVVAKTINYRNGS